MKISLLGPTSVRLEGPRAPEKLSVIRSKFKSNGFFLMTHTDKRPVKNPKRVIVSLANHNRTITKAERSNLKNSEELYRLPKRDSKYSIFGIRLFWNRLGHFDFIELPASSGLPRPQKLCTHSVQFWPLLYRHCCNNTVPLQKLKNNFCKNWKNGDHVVFHQYFSMQLNKPFIL